MDYITNATEPSSNPKTEAYQPERLIGTKWRKRGGKESESTVSQLATIMHI